MLPVGNARVCRHVFIVEGEFQTLFKQEETYDPSKYTFEFVSGQCYDHIWVTALALNCTDTYLKALGRIFVLLRVT